MCTVWKMDSKWGDEGRILDVFSRLGSVFVGNAPEKVDEICRGDLIAITQGHDVLAIGLAIGGATGPDGLGFTEEDRRRFPGARGVKIRLAVLNEEDRFKYSPRRSICYAPSISEEIHRLYKEYTHAFKIESEVYRLGFLSNSENTMPPLIGEGTRFIIPIYQRPYSWDEDQVSRLFSDLWRAFEMQTESESQVFIGAMQMSFPLWNDYEKTTCMREIVDGQQRISTLYLLLKMLQAHYPEGLLKDVDMTWLETRVNSGMQQDALDAVSDGTEEAALKSRYQKNFALLQGQWNSADDGSIPDQSTADRFVQFLNDYVCMVVVETQASLSKTLSIFDTINTAGMDLGASDLFKIRFYDYLISLEEADDRESLFEAISDLYARIDRGNEEAGRIVTTMDEMLGIYRYLILVESDMPWGLSKLGAGAFFERLFDTLQESVVWDSWDKQKIPTKLISIETLSDLIDAQFVFEEQKEQFSQKGRCFYSMLHWSLYHRFWFAGVFAAYAKKNSKEELERIITAISKMAIAYSTIYGKRVNAVWNKMKTILKGILSEGRSWEQSLSDMMARDIRTGDDMQNKFSCEIRYKLAWNRVGKNLVCRLSAMLEEPDAEDIHKKLFESNLDIEHIQPCNDSDKENREKIDKEWEDLLNGIGNLVVLDMSLNRSISNKVHEDKYAAYQESDLKIVKAIPEKWSVELAEERREKEGDKIWAGLQI